MYIFESYLYRKPRMLMFMEKSMKHQSIERPAVIVFAISYFSSERERKYLKFFDTDLALSTAHCVSSL